MKKRLVALGMAAVMVVGGGVMAFGEEPGNDPTSNRQGVADVLFTSDIETEVREPEDPDFPDDTPPGPGEPNYGIDTMSLHFGTRDIYHVGPTLVMSTLDLMNPENRSYNALAVNPPADRRIMGVTVINGNITETLQVQVQRTNFMIAGGYYIDGVDFSLVPNGNPIMMGIGEPTVSTSRTVVGLGAGNIITSTWGGSIVSFSGELTGVHQSQAQVASAQATLTWSFVPPMTP